ncbi:MAG TPA: TIGR03118 family protein [Bacteroidota bacterium]|nr:TIGR03118 family protein [Bacteroidota bacterium]
MQPYPVLRRAAAGTLSTALFLLFAVLSGCRSNVNDPPMQSILQSKQMFLLSKEAKFLVQQVNLVANAASYNARRTDPVLLNAWGIAITPTGIIWIAANHSSLSVVYDTDGNVKRSPVMIPTHDSSGGGAPTGTVFNGTTDFVIPGTSAVSRFIFSGEDGIISAWSPPAAGAVVVADRSESGAVYKGLALASDGSHNFLYATNFKGGSVDVFDDHFQFVSTKPFSDPSIPAGFAPFGIQNIGGKLFVTYAKRKPPENMDDQKGPGNGYVDVYRPDGTLIKRFASQGSLNSPWGLARVPDEGFRNLEDAILVGNFGDGRINVFDEDGEFRGQLSDGTSPITIDGLWALTFRKTPKADDEGDGDNNNGDHHAVQAQRLFFTAGPNEENDGLFGYLLGATSNERDRRIESGQSLPLTRSR